MEDSNKKCCMNCMYFRFLTMKVAPGSEHYDGYCRKRQKYKKLDDVHNCFCKRK